MMKNEQRRPGVVLAPDDLAAGQLVTVHHWHDGLGGRPSRSRRAATEYLMGVALRIKAVNLPYLVVQPLNDEKASPVILDFRKAALMAVSREYADAQAGAAGPAATEEDSIPF